MTEIVRLRLSYAAKLPARVARLKEAFSPFRSSLPDEQTLKSMWHSSHKLAGSAAMYGFAEVGEAARILASLVRGGPLASDRWADEVLKCLDALEGAVERATPFA